MTNDDQSKAGSNVSVRIVPCGIDDRSVTPVQAAGQRVVIDIPGQATEFLGAFPPGGILPDGSHGSACYYESVRNAPTSADAR